MDVVLNKEREEINKFSCELFRQILNKKFERNTVVAPVSANWVLSTILNLAGHTEENTTPEISEEVLNSDYFKTANGVWINLSECPFEIKEEDGNNIFCLGSFNRETITEINNWVSENTNRKINHVFDENYELPPIVVVNAMYFKGKWGCSFSNAGPYPFFPDYDSFKHVMVDYISSEKREFKNFSNDDCIAVEIPYHNKRYSMFIIMPYKIENWRNVLDNLPDIINKINTTEETIETKLYIPKFEIEDANNLTPYLNIPEKLKGLVEVNQKTYIKVDEEGTEAAAATYGILKSFSFKIDGLIINRAFIFVIYDKKENVILFMGAIFKL